VTANYQNIGLITITNADELTAKVRDTVRRKACGMGADAVSMNASVDFGSSLVKGMTQFLVLRKPEAPVQQAEAPVVPKS
jgi:hypothetical protein